MEFRVTRSAAPRTTCHGRPTPRVPAALSAPGSAEPAPTARTSRQMRCQSRPCSRRPSTKVSCSSAVQRPAAQGETAWERAKYVLVGPPGRRRAPERGRGATHAETLRPDAAVQHQRALAVRGGLSAHGAGLRRTPQLRRGGACRTARSPDVARRPRVPPPPPAIRAHAAQRARTCAAHGGLRGVPATSSCGVRCAELPYLVSSPHRSYRGVRGCSVL
jgi:hypothetical protein